MSRIISTIAVASNIAARDLALVDTTEDLCEITEFEEIVDGYDGFLVEFKDRLK